jgi:hypothetical protein
MTATSETPREGRFIDVLFGARLVVALAARRRFDVLGFINLPRGKVRERYDGWDRYIK